MINKEIAVCTTTLNRDIKTMETALYGINLKMLVMFNSINQLDKMWDGPANQAFNAQFKEDQEYMASLCKSLNDLMECFKYAEKEYNECEELVEQLISGINV